LTCTASRALLATAALLVFALGSAAAQTTKLERQLSHVDLGVSGSGQFTRDVSGKVIPTGASNCYLTPPPNTGPCTTVLTQSASNTLGALATLRYIAKPLVGLEFNYGWARYTEGYSPSPVAGLSLFQIQTTYNETTLGYVITPAHTLFGLQPFASAGLGSINFKPTGGGGQGVPNRARAAYYYNVGLQREFPNSHFGIRASFRQVFFIAPDFGQNFLDIKQHTIATQPTAGFYLRF
jgi:hypothetical protein